MLKIHLKMNETVLIPMAASRLTWLCNVDLLRSSRISHQSSIAVCWSVFQIDRTVVMSRITRPALAVTAVLFCTSIAAHRLVLSSVNSTMGICLDTGESIQLFLRYLLRILQIHYSFYSNSLGLHISI